VEGLPGVVKRKNEVKQKDGSKMKKGLKKGGGRTTTLKKKLREKKYGE